MARKPARPPAGRRAKKAGEPAEVSRETPTGLTRPDANGLPGPAAQVLRWIVTGQSDADVAQAIAHYWPELPVEQVAQHVADELQKAGRPDQDMIRGFCIEASREVLKRALEAGEFVAALRAIANIADLASTYDGANDEAPP